MFIDGAIIAGSEDGEKKHMNRITTKDGAEIYYKDWSSGRPPGANPWDGHIIVLGQHGYRVVAQDRRGYARADQPRTATRRTPTPATRLPSWRP
ncbi:MAG: Non-heme chloroperoxidase [Candidatus Solibacter sp.]|jgi:hypothetical protein|nr:Non-heme chloroperoxidase [Candidatus Solibacter sp.]